MRGHAAGCDGVVCQCRESESNGDKSRRSKNDAERNSTIVLSFVTLVHLFIFSS